MKAVMATLLLTTAAPALAQHEGHRTPPASPATSDDSEKSERQVMDHGAMDHAQMDHAPEADHAQMNHGQTNHAQMNHAQMDHEAMGHEAMDPEAMDHAPVSAAAPAAETPPPAAAGSGPPRAADAIWGADAMAQSRRDLARNHGGQRVSWFMADRAEYRVHEGKNGYLWDLQGSYGGDLDKFFYKSEGEGNAGERIERAEVQALWSHAIAPFFDLQAGVRQDFAPRDRTYAVIGVQGLAPYRFEVDGALFLSDQGDLTARVEAEIDQRITQRLILQPRVEANMAAQDVPELGIGAGLDRIEAGLRLRYEIVREFAPYIGIEQEWHVGRSADYARAAGEDASVTNYVVGVRVWF